MFAIASRKLGDEDVVGASTMEEKRAEIRGERERKKGSTVEGILEFLRHGKIMQARQNLIFHTDPSLFAEKLEAILNHLNRDFEKADQETKRRLLVFLTKLTLDLLSFLPEWNLTNKELHGERALARTDIEKHIARSDEILASWSDQEEALAESLLEEWLNETKGRFRVEGISDESEAEQLAANLVRSSVLEYTGNMRDSFKRSNLRRICELRVSRRTQTEIGNDHTTNLEYAMWLGASFVTTNPQLVQVAWELDPEFWTPRVDEMIKSRYSLEGLRSLMRKGSREQIENAIEQVNTDLTMEVVLENAKMLRGIFLLSEGQRGLVCLQVNPLKHSDADAMNQEALQVYSKLTERIGGVPNVVFKLPATKAGLEAAETLTSRGIGVTITVSFGLFQALPFADVINRGHAITSYLVVMNGRLAHPVMEELKKFGEDLARAGRWAGIAVAKKLYQKLYAPVNEGGRGYDSKRIRLIIASLRNYEGSFPDITELIGVPIITVFPNIRRAFDAEEREIDANRIEEPVDDKVLEGLLRSELFKQAYYVSDDGDVKPSSPFYLEDEEKVLEYPPVKNTLGQFCEYRIKTGQLVRQRIDYLIDRMMSPEAVTC